MRGYSDETLTRAKRLRRRSTDAERKLWTLLRSRQLDGLKFRRQQPIGPYIVDFDCQKRRLIIEADGGQHSGSETDNRRTAFLQSKGYRVIRFWNNEVLENLEGVAQRIMTSSLSPHPAPAAPESPSPSRGEGPGEPHGRAI